MRYLSVCSGIEAATVAWEPLGWEPVAFSEIDPFPSAVLEHHWPHVRNLGDFTKIRDERADLLVGGTPCQSFSVAGLREGLGDPRGNLALEYLALARRLRARWLVWENVPGVLSTNEGRDFGAFLGGLAELGYGWAYRVLDAQYFGVAQRRRRVFVVGHLGDWRRAAAVLLERACLRGDPPPSREAGEGASAATAPSLTRSGRGVERAGESRGQDPVVAIQEVGKRQSGTPQNGVGHAPPGAPMYTLQAGAQHGVAMALNAHGGSGRMDAESETLLPTALSSAYSNSGVEEGLSPTLSGPPMAVALGFSDVADPVAANQDRTYTREGKNNFRLSNVAVAFDPHQVTCPDNRSNPQPGVAHTMPARSQPPHLASPSAVRRLTPTECERLQGFPDGHTLVPYRCKPAKDGPRYKAIGNSMAVPVMSWLGERIAAVEEIGGTR